MSFISGQIIVSPEYTREPRQRRLLGARMAGNRFAKQDIIIRNISARGLGAASRGIAPVMGEQVSVQFSDGMTVVGSVRWVANLAFGLAFETPLDPDNVANVKRRSAQADSSAAVWEVARQHRVPTPTATKSTLRRV